MTIELTAMWATIAEAYPYAKTAIEKASTVSDGMPHAPTDPRKTPVNLTALSWVELVDRLTAKWGHTVTTMPTAITQLWNNLGPADQLDLQTDTWTIHNGATQWLPAHTQTQRLTAEQCAGIHCATIQELSWALNSLGLETSINTVKSWVRRGHINKTPAGYSLAEAQARVSA